MSWSAALHGLMLFLLLKFRGATSVCLHLHSITVVPGSLSADQLSLTDAEREREEGGKGQGRSLQIYSLAKESLKKGTVTIPVVLVFRLLRNTDSVAV